MRCIRCATLALLLMVSTATADDEAGSAVAAPSERGYAGLSLLTGFDDKHLPLGLVVEGGLRTNTWLSVRGSGSIAALTKLELPGGGGTSSGRTVHRVALGLEARGCPRRGRCVVGGVEGGYYRDEHHSEVFDETFHGALIGLRAGIEMGDQDIRFRATLGFLTVYRQLDDYPPGRMGFQVALDATLGIAVRF
jgi:hypothetical protein